MCQLGNWVKNRNCGETALALIAAQAAGEAGGHLGHCLAHARRRFVEVIENFPQPCRHALEQLGKVNGHDAKARQQA